MRNVIVLDTSNQPYYRNQLFDPAIAAYYPGALAFCRFYALATDAGYQVMTADCAVRDGFEGERTIVISEQTTPWTERLAHGGASLGVLLSLETPSFAWRFYRDLHKISQRYRHAFLFAGAAPRVRSEFTRFHPIFFPQPYKEIPEAGKRAWEQRTFMALINSNLVRYVISPAHVLASLTDPDLRRELYSERRRAIRYFCQHEGFHIYGRHWQKWRLGVSYSDYKAALRCYKGSCENKITTLAKYRFSICFENTDFPGYITEKIFDCFYAGCVPVYYGAPDICQYIPKECFIDFHDFTDYRSLDDFLAQVGPKELETYRQAAADFLHSRQFELFSQDYFAGSLLSAIEDCTV